MTLEQELERELTSLQNRAAEVRQQLEVVRQERKQWRCTNCNKSSLISKCILLRSHWYDDQPYAAYWKFSHYIIVCPKCNGAVRVHPPSLYEDARQEPGKTKASRYSFVHKYERIFGEVLNYCPPGGYGGTIDLEKIRKQNKRYC